MKFWRRDLTLILQDKLLQAEKKAKEKELGTRTNKVTFTTLKTVVFLI